MLQFFCCEENHKCRRVGMADEADSKSVVGNHVRVQVPLPAVHQSTPEYDAVTSWGCFLVQGLMEWPKLEEARKARTMVRAGA